MSCMLSCFSHVQLCMTLCTAAYQTPLSMRFSRQGYWSGLPFPTPGDLPGPGMEPFSLMFPALAGRFCRTLGFRVHHQLQGLAQTHVHRISDAIQPS